MFDTEVLKGKILQLAIQGKLVDRCEEEGSANDFYNHIVKEETTLILKHKSKKAKELTLITEDDIPFDIPKSWKWMALGDICEIINGFTPDKKNNLFWENSDVPWFTIEDIRSQGRHIYNTKQGFSSCVLGENAKRMLPPHSVLLCCTASIGEYAISEIPLVTNQQFNGLVIKEMYKDFISYEYLFAIAPVFKDWLLANAGKTTISFISASKLSMLPIPIPPMGEQKRIVSIINQIITLLDSIDENMKFYEQDQAKLYEKILYAAIKGKLVEQRSEEGTADYLYKQIQKEKKELIEKKIIKKDKKIASVNKEEIPFDIPSTWKWVNLADLGFLSSGKTPNMAIREYWDGGTINWMTSKDMKKKILTESEMQITEAGSLGMKLYPPGTLLMVVRSGILKRTLPICILSQSSTINQDLKAFSLFDDEMSDYIYYALKGLEPLILKGYTKKSVTVDSLKVDEFFYNMPFPLPPKEEQKRIVEKIDELMPMCERCIE